MVIIEARKRQIENEAIRLRWQIWHARQNVLRHPPHPLEVLDPQIAAAELGFQLQYLDRLSFGVGQQNFETAGLLDRSNKKITIAQCYGPEAARFTAAHELGHAVLHEDRIILHRDLPIRGLEEPLKDPIEREANYFAGVFLMPTEFLTKVFRQMFGSAPLAFNHDVASLLRPNDPGSLLHAYPGSKARSVALATARSFGVGNTFNHSLAEFFQVSVATMSIRLRELELVQDYP
jgi:Zn-dependent peptidase ImmA (M78 family)